MNSSDIMNEYNFGNAIKCKINSDCGTNVFIGNPFCSSGNAFQNYITYTCNNPGINSSYCSNATSAIVVMNCSSSQTCLSGSCVGVTCFNDSQCNDGNHILLINVLAQVYKIAVVLILL